MTTWMRMSGLLAWAGLVGLVSAAEPIEFNRDIRPVLSDHCFACHGPDPASRKADLRLDTRSGAFGNGIVVPGDTAGSELIRRIRSNDPEERMPPPDAHKTLDADQRELLARWVQEGAVWQEHWAFIPPRRPVLPQPAGAGEWARNPVDLFILSKLREKGLEPGPEADRHTLARRVALDVTGLPPEPDALSGYLNDQREGAFDRYVDLLLASKHAGEQRARYWLDAARYGDTHGMHVDNYREMWPYRDWVVRAFNENLPFDRFVVEQIAGDLLPDPGLDQRIATGFSRCNITTSEGGAIPEEVNVRYMVDRVETTATVFLGLTAGCAVCHDHKYDPLSQREFYSLGAFFNNTTQPPMDGNEKDTPPVVVLPEGDLKTEWDALLGRRAHLRSDLARLSWKGEEAWKDRMPMGTHPVGEEQLLAFHPLTASAEDGLKIPDDAFWETEHPAGKRGLRFEKPGGIQVPGPALRSDEPLSISFWVKAPDQLLSTVFMEQMDTVATGKDGKSKKPIGWRISSSTQGAITFEMNDGRGGKITGLLAGEEALTPRVWQHVCVRYSGGRSKTAMTILVNGENRRMRNATQSYIEAVDLKPVPIKMATRLPSGGVSDVRVFRRWLTEAEVQALADEFRLRPLLAADRDWADLGSEDRRALTRYFNQALNLAIREKSRQLAATQLRRDFIHSRSVTTLVMEERPGQAPRAWVLARGEYDQRREEVHPAVPAILPPLPEGAPRNRLGLARWLVHPDHPLTARVTVNRLWQSLFGTGLVKTSEDFGVMGERPSHPELLDWLAVEFVQSGWDVKHMLRLMLQSATYRQSSRVTAASLEQDPGNRYLSRAPRLRLDAEVLRDQALYVSGLLVREVGGPSVKPYQPDGLWNIVAITGSNTRVFKRDAGAALYRRSLYTFWKRTAPPPSMAAFDAPTREQCTVRRERTNTPLQALVLLNDPQFMEAARHLAQRTVRFASNDEARARWMFEIALSRPPSAADLQDLTALAADFRRHFVAAPSEAKALIETGESPADATLDRVEVAAWTMCANTLMNRDDFINRN